MDRTYTPVITRSSSGCVGHAREYPGAIAQGSTEQELLANLDATVAVHLRMAEKLGYDPTLTADRAARAGARSTSA